MTEANELNSGQEPQPTLESSVDQPQISMIKRALGGDTEVSMRAGGVVFKNMGEVVDSARLMARSGEAVPLHCRDNAGMCWAIILQAVEWNMLPTSVARMSYVTNGILSYMSQIWHAVVEHRKVLKERLHHRYEGEGEDRVCIVYGTFKGEDAPREHRSPPLSQVRPPLGNKTDADGNRIRKGSPLWDKKPDLQLYYDTSRDWVRIYAPDVMLGIYSPEEIEAYEGTVGTHAIDVTDAARQLQERLVEARVQGAAKLEGFHANVVEDGLREDAPQTPREGQGEAEHAARSKVAAKGENKPRRTVAVSSAAGKKAARSRKQAAEARADVSHETPASDLKEKLQASVAAVDAEPKNVGQYAAHLKAWLKVATDEAAIRNRWSQERALRNRCNMTSEDREPLERAIRQRIEQIGDDGKED